MAGGWIYFFGAIASTILAYNFSSWLAQKAFLAFVPESVAEYVEYADKYLPQVVKNFYKKAMIVQSVVESIVLFGGNLFFLWLFNTILLQILITWECRRVSFQTLDIAARNALAGAISASVILFVWNLLTIIPFPLTKLLIAIEGFPLIGWMIIPLILLIFNLAFGAIGKAVALSQGCAAEAEPQNGTDTEETFDDIGNSPYPYINHDYEQCDQSHQSYQQKTCDINNIVGCLPTEHITPHTIDHFDSCNTSGIVSVCQNKPFGFCNRLQREQIIPLKFNNIE